MPSIWFQFLCYIRLILKRIIDKILNNRQCKYVVLLESGWIGERERQKSDRETERERISDSKNWDTWLEEGKWSSEINSMNIRHRERGNSLWAQGQAWITL